MLGYICKYAPVEVFESMGVKMERIEPDVTNFNQAEIRMHPEYLQLRKRCVGRGHEQRLRGRDPDHMLRQYPQAL